MSWRMIKAALMLTVASGCATLVLADPPVYDCYKPGDLSYYACAAPGVTPPNLSRKCPTVGGVDCFDVVVLNEAVTTVGPALTSSEYGHKNQQTTLKNCHIDRYRCVANGEQFKCEMWVGTAEQTESSVGYGEICTGAPD